jgi:hypothetical protein
MKQFATALTLLAGCSLFPSPATPPAAEGVAALAVRDDVVGWQEWGTRTHSEPFLERAYRSYRYLEEQGSTRADHRLRFREELAALLATHQAVDLFLLAHANRYLREVERLDPALTARLRLVYNTGAGDLDQAHAWLALGAKAYLAHPGANVAPLFYARFLPRWVAGDRLEVAVAASNQATQELIEGPLDPLLRAGRSLGFERLPDARGLWEGTEAVIAGDPALAIR